MIIAKICEVNPRNILIRNLRRKLFVSEKYLFNLFYATGLCLYLPKTSKKKQKRWWFSDVFGGEEKGEL